PAVDRRPGGPAALRPALATARPVERYVPGGQRAAGHRPEGDPAGAAGLVRRRPGPGRGVCAMPDVLDSANPGRGDREVTAGVPSPAGSNGHVAAAPVLSTQYSVLSPQYSAPPLLLFDRVTKWYGPVIGVNQVTLELRSGITGLVGSNGAGK